eukprot:m.24532 g.24532  ORF g.24532 m.24532 type:complete len:61 (+) comp11523_c0_seq4:957-1139(+)
MGFVCTCLQSVPADQCCALPVASKSGHSAVFAFCPSWASDLLSVSRTVQLCACISWYESP